MVWTRTDEERRLCNMWLENPLVNPETGRPIERNGPTFKKWRSRCKRVGLLSTPRATKELTWRKCQAWRQNPTVNPDSGKRIKEGGPTWRWLQRSCAAITEPTNVELTGEYYLPDKNGMVPTIKSRDKYYIVRKINGRKVWGPLNKPARHILLRYYTDTWDYKYQHYRPVFVGTPPPPPSRAIQRSTASAANFLSLFTN